MPKYLQKQNRIRYMILAMFSAASKAPLTSLISDACSKHFERRLFDRDLHYAFIGDEVCRGNIMAIFDIAKV